MTFLEALEVSRLLSTIEGERGLCFDAPAY